LDPDQNALRDQGFAARAVELSRTHHIRLELAGGILAHTYYQLVHGGALVDCVDPFESVDDVESFGKLVRDRVPDKVIVGGESVEVRTLKGEELIAALKSKVLEEALEVFGAAGRGALIEELADLEEVIGALCSRLSIDAREIREIRAKKNEQRGAFEEGYVLLRTRTPRLERGADEGRLFNDPTTQGEGKSTTNALFECGVATPESSKIEITIPLIPPHQIKELTRKLTVRGQVMLMSARNEGKRIHLTVEMLPVPEQLRLLLSEAKEQNILYRHQRKSRKTMRSRRPKETQSGRKNRGRHKKSRT